MSEDYDWTTAMRARVSELEAQLDSERAINSSVVAQLQASRMLLEVSRGECDRALAKLAAANADRARLHGALAMLMDTTIDQTYCLSATCGRCQECDARSALASSDAAAWLHERDMRVAEAVRSACIEAMRVDGTPTGMLRCIMEPFDLAAVVAGVK